MSKIKNDTVASNLSTILLLGERESQLRSIQDCVETLNKLYKEIRLVKGRHDFVDACAERVNIRLLQRDLSYVVARCRQEVLDLEKRLRRD